jgi:predicted transglutaminase-like cysteine proteinase
MMSVSEKELQDILEMVDLDYTPDRESKGMSEYWQSFDELTADIAEDGKLNDDCEGFAMQCWQLCLQRSIPARIVFCKTEDGEGHLVCEVEGWILDNRYPFVMKQNELSDYGYLWIKISGYQPGGKWKEIIDG